jgi:cytochrome b
MVVAWLADAIATGLTGWRYTTDRFWCMQWLAQWHGALGEALMLHMAGAVYTSWRHQEHLIASMRHGRKPVGQTANPTPDL